MLVLVTKRLVAVAATRPLCGVVLFLTLHDVLHLIFHVRLAALGEVGRGVNAQEGCYQGT